MYHLLRTGQMSKQREDELEVVAVNESALAADYCKVWSRTQGEPALRRLASASAQRCKQLRMEVLSPDSTDMHLHDDAPHAQVMQRLD